MSLIFDIVYSILMGIAEITGFTYNEVNIIAYFIVLPFAYVFLADRILKTHLLKIFYVLGVTIFLLQLENFSGFSDWLFQKSVDFLLSFKSLGWNYVVASVLICVVFPAIVFLAMVHFAYPRFFPEVRRCLRLWHSES